MRILVISVHPDDETLGCGGTLLKHKKLEEEICWLIVTSPKHEQGYTQDFIKDRKEQIQKVSKAYGFKKVYELNFSPAELYKVDYLELLNSISQVIKDVEPELIYMPNRTDIHTDHQIVAEILFSSLKSFRNLFVKKILMYECISETEMASPLPEKLFIPNVYSDITDFINQKIEIMKCYQSEIQERPLPRSLENIKALACFRGSSVGKMYAEAFMLVREIF